jgi:Fic family protein
MSTQIRAERSAYYDILEHTQRSSTDVTAWLEWFVGCLTRTIDNAQDSLATVLQKSQFWDRHQGASLNDRQRQILNRLLDGFEGKMTTSKWAKLAKCSQDTAYRDIQFLVDQRIMVKDDAGGRSTSYSIREP